MTNAWQDFQTGIWQEEINVRDFIQKNYEPYEGDEHFLSPLSPKTQAVWSQADQLIREEVSSGQISVDLEHFSGINAFAPGYIDQSNEVIVGLQTDAPLKRIMNPYGGFRMVESSLAAYNLHMDPALAENFQRYRKSHNQGVFDAYTAEMRAARHVGLLTGLPDAYGRGRIIGDYRRIALYGIDFLRAQRLKDYQAQSEELASEDCIRRREELSEEYRALDEIRQMAASYGFDISRPAETAQEAVQWLYFGYLAAIKENNGAAMSIGRNTSFLDIYIQRDLKRGHITESEAQELIDQLIIKLRLARHLRTPEYDELFAGDPTWVTESIGGMGEDGRTLVTRTAFRFLHTLSNLGSAPEPNMTVLWSQNLPAAFKAYCAKMSIRSGALQYENDDVMRPIYGDDYAIACCVSAMKIGKQMQFFGARANLAKALLYAINGGVDEVKRDKNGQPYAVLAGIDRLDDEILSYERVYANYLKILDKLSRLYVNTMNTIHFMHDKYAYEAGQMALHDAKLHRFMAFGIAGISIVADSLSAIKYAKVRPIRNAEGLAIDFEIEGDFPKYGNDDDRVDSLAVDLTRRFSAMLKRFPTYREAEHTLSLLTITSNVVYGKKTGATPDGRKAGEPFAPGANPMHGRDNSGALASLNSVAKIPYDCVCQDGISNTFSIIPDSLGHDENSRIQNLSNILDGYFVQHAFHLNVNVLDRLVLKAAMEHPEQYPNLTIRVSGYAVRFNRLSREQQEEVLRRTFHEHI